MKIKRDDNLECFHFLSAIIFFGTASCYVMVLSLSLFLLSFFSLCISWCLLVCFFFCCLFILIILNVFLYFKTVVKIHIPMSNCLLHIDCIVKTISYASARSHSRLQNCRMISTSKVSIIWKFRINLPTLFIC